MLGKRVLRSATDVCTSCCERRTAVYGGAYIVYADVTERRRICRHGVVEEKRDGYSSIYRVIVKHTHPQRPCKHVIHTWKPTRAQQHHQQHSLDTSVAACSPPLPTRLLVLVLVLVATSPEPRDGGAAGGVNTNAAAYCRCATANTNSRAFMVPVRALQHWSPSCVFRSLHFALCFVSSVLSLPVRISCCLSLEDSTVLISPGNRKIVGKIQGIGARRPASLALLLCPERTNTESCCPPSSAPRVSKHKKKKKNARDCQNAQHTRTHVERNFRFLVSV